MRDVELLVRYYAFRNFLSDYKGNLKEFLDETCKDLNASWQEQKAKIEEQGRELSDAINFTYEIFDENAFRRWDGDAFESRFNRAIYDVMVYYFSQPHVRKAAKSKRTAIQKDFQKLCSQNDDFRTAIELTTKSVPATATRLRLWGQALSKRIGRQLALPRLVGKRIEIGR